MAVAASRSSPALVSLCCCSVFGVRWRERWCTGPGRERAKESSQVCSHFYTHFATDNVIFISLRFAAATFHRYAASMCCERVRCCRAISFCIHEHEVNMFNTIVRLNRTQCVIFFPRRRSPPSLSPAADSFIYLFLFYFVVLLRLMVLLALAIASTYP